MSNFKWSKKNGRKKLVEEEFFGIWTNIQIAKYTNGRISTGRMFK
jgi:hypothetical protein